MKSSRNHISPSGTRPRHGVKKTVLGHRDHPLAQPIIQEIGNPTRMTIKFSVSSVVAPKAWEHLLEAMKEFEELYQVALADLDIKSISTDTAS